MDAKEDGRHAPPAPAPEEQVALPACRPAGRQQGGWTACAPGPRSGGIGMPRAFGHPLATLKGRAVTSLLAQGLPAGGYAGRPRAGQDRGRAGTCPPPGSQVMQDARGLGRSAASGGSDMVAAVPACASARAAAGAARPRRPLRGTISPPRHPAPAIHAGPAPARHAGRPPRPRGRPAGPGRRRWGRGRGRPRRPSLRLHGCRARQPACEPRRRWTCPRPSAALCKSTCGRGDPRACAALALPIWPGLLNSTRCRSGSTDCCWPVRYRTRGMRTGAACPCGRARPCQARRGHMIRHACPARRPVPAPLRCAGRAAAAGSRPPLASLWHEVDPADLGGRTGKSALPNGGGARALGSPDPASDERPWAYGVLSATNAPLKRPAHFSSTVPARVGAGQNAVFLALWTVHARVTPLGYPSRRPPGPRHGLGARRRAEERPVHRVGHKAQGRIASATARPRGGCRLDGGRRCQVHGARRWRGIAAWPACGRPRRKAVREQRTWNFPNIRKCQCAPHPPVYRFRHPWPSRFHVFFIPCVFIYNPVTSRLGNYGQFSSNGLDALAPVQAPTSHY